MKIINLLPKHRQQDLYYESILHSLFSVIKIVIASFILVVLVQIGVQFYLNNESKQISLNIELLKSQVNKQSNAEVKKQIQDQNNKIADYKNLADAAPKWSKVLASFAVLPPPGLNMSSFNVDYGSKLITITGQSPTRELVIKLYENILADTEHFYSIDYPLENIVNAKDVNFHFTFFVKDNLLK